MNKQELIDKYEDKLKDVQLKFGANFKTKVYEELLEDLKQLDEPQKPVVPQFVADWIEEGKKHCKDVSDLFDFDFTNVKMCLIYSILILRMKKSVTGFYKKSRLT